MKGVREEGAVGRRIWALGLVVLLVIAIAIAVGRCSRPEPSGDLTAVAQSVERLAGSAGTRETVPVGEHRRMYKGDGVGVDQSGYGKLDMGCCVLDIYRDTELRIQGVPSESAPVCLVDFAHGTIYNRVEKEIIINTEWAVITSLGTEFLVHLDRQRGRLWVMAKKGKVQVEAAQRRVQVDPGMETWVGRGRAPERPLPAMSAVREKLFPLPEDLTNGRLNARMLLAP